ncbi:MAG: DNA-directed RNA polymerase subunit alpha [Gemmatimonadota bacterium]|nr:MAG: DNA-directed RNA polymerase subunit alpha [Gemmatimonadota bacterium]
MKWKSLIMPKGVELDENSFSDRYGKFSAEPLERGYGHTLGNALRRVLLSSLQGAAITSLKIDNILHELSTIPGIVEDVTEIVLNMKEVRIKLHTNHTKKVVVEHKGKGELTAGVFQTDTDIEILNPDHHIATLDADADLRMEVTIGSGRGYIPAELNRKQDQPIGTIPLDAIFTPITKVNYTVESTRVGQRIDYDKLILEIWTDGTITPDDAMATAARILRDHLKLFISFEEEPEEVEIEEVDEETVRIRNLLRMSVDELELSVRSSNCLKAAEIKTLKDLVQKTEAEMLKYRNFGRKSLQELNEILSNYGLSFGMNVQRYLEKTVE